jgi:hypothetical protein
MTNFRFQNARYSNENYLESIFTNSGKCSEEVLYNTEQAFKAKKALNSLYSSK